MNPVSSHQMTVQVNGQVHHISTDPLRTLAAVLRDDLGLTGTKLGCEAGDCGACSVLLDGMAVASCLLPVAHARGRNVTTVEGLADRPSGAALLQAFRRHNACQCGFCIPGFLVRAEEIVERGERLDREHGAFAMAGNLCRCTGYEAILDAVLEAADEATAGRAVGKRDGGDELSDGVVQEAGNHE